MKESTDNLTLTISLIEIENRFIDFKKFPSVQILILKT